MHGKSTEKPEDTGKKTASPVSFRFEHNYTTVLCLLTKFTYLEKSDKGIYILYSISFPKLLKLNHSLRLALHAHEWAPAKPVYDM